METSYFVQKFDVDILAHWQNVWDDYVEKGYAQVTADRIELTMDGLLRVDGLLPAFFEEEHQGVRYT